LLSSFQELSLQGYSVVDCSC